MFSIQQKLMALGLVVLLPIGGYYAGKFVESNACTAKATVKQLTSELKGRERDDKIDKEVDRMDSDTLDHAYMHWVR